MSIGDGRSALQTRQRVRHRGMLPGEPDARVWRITPSGVWVTRASGKRECWHPDDVIPAASDPR